MLRFLSPLVLVAVALLALPSPAVAQSWWTTEAETCGGAIVNGQQVGSERGSGQMDGNGNFYLPCSANEATGAHDNYIAVFNAAGVRVNRIPLDFTPNDGQRYTDRASDVAPSPDGAYLYVVHYASYTTYRFDRQADGSYVANPAWQLANYPGADGGGSYRPLGQFIATDGNGDIYFSSGLWACNVGCTDDAIVKYRPDGSYVTRFGRKVGGSWALGHSAGSFGGLAVTATGCRVFVTDVNNSRVQRFDSTTRDAAGRCPAVHGQQYGAMLSMGMNEANDPNRWGACYADGVLAAPYDVAMSARGELLVLNTTCYNDNRYAAFPYATIEVQRFGQDGSVRGSILATSRGIHRVHGIAVDRANGIHLVQAKAVLRPAAGWTDAGADAGGGGPVGGTAAVDATAPVITALSVTPTTTTGTAVTIGIAATDASGVAHVRITEDGVAGPWQAYAQAIAHTITERIGAHQLVVEVRDTMGNVSAASAVTVTRVAPPAPEQPTDPSQPVKPIQPTKPNQPANPTNPKPTKPSNPVQPGNGTVQGGGAVSAERPVITRVQIPVQIFRGRTFTPSLAARGIGGVPKVRFSTNGKWTAWRSLRRPGKVVLPVGAGWHGVFVQVQDGVGTTSIPWFQPVLVGPRGMDWKKGTRKADRLKFGRGNQFIDLSSFDQQVDRVSCGPGYDTVYAQPNDIVAKDCERVLRVKMPAW